MQKNRKKAFIRILIFLFFCTNSLSSFSQNNSEKEFRSIFTSLDTITTNFEKIKLLTSTAGQNRYTRQSHKLIVKAIEIAEQDEENIHLAHSYYSMGNYYYYQSKTDSSLIYLDKAQNFSEKSNDPLITPLILATKAGVYNKLSKVTLAISTQIKAKEILDKINSLSLNKEQKYKLKGQKLVLNNSLANLYNKTEDYNKALFYYENAYQNAINLGSNANASIILGNKGDLLIKTNKPNEALETLQQSKKMKLKAKLPERFIGTSYLNIGLAYSTLKEYKNAIKSFDTAYSIFSKNNVPDGKMRVTVERGLLLNKFNKPKLALANCTEGKKIALETNDSEYTYKACNCLFQANKKLGNYNEALKNHELYTVIKDSLFNEKNIRKITQVGMQYEFDKKNAVQKLLLEKRKNERNQVLVGIATLFLLLIGTFSFFKKRIKYQKTIATQTADLQKQKITDLQQKNKLIALNSMIEGQEAERLRIAKDLHDSLGGLLSTVKTHFNIIKSENKVLDQSNITQRTNNLIDEACIEVRRISHDMIPHALSISGLEGAIEDLGERLNKGKFNSTVEITNLPNKIDETKKATIYRLIQEIISNIKKHAQAKNILIQLIGHNEGINLMIEDDGIGFNFSEAIKKSGLGLKSINSRVEFLDGTINWDSEINKGTTVIINIPI